MNPLLLTTNRLHLHPLEPTDFERLHSYLTDPSIRHYLWDGEVILPETTEEILERNEHYFEFGQYGLWEIEDQKTGTLMGFAGLWHFYEEAKPKLLCALLPEFEGQGYALEVAERICDYTFEELEFSYLEASIDAEDFRAIRLASRLGMSKIDEKIVNGRLSWFFHLERPS